MGFSQDGKFYSDKYISLHSLERNTKKRPFLDIFRRTVDACFILYILTSRTEFFDAKLPNNLKALAKNQNVTFMGALILRHQQILPTNVHSVRHWLSIYIDIFQCVCDLFIVTFFASLSTMAFCFIIGFFGDYVNLYFLYYYL